VMPGFIDSHTHLAFPAAAEDDEHAARLVRASTGHRLEAKLRAYLEAMARHGTTTVETKMVCGPDENAEAKLQRVFSALRGNPLDLVPSFLCRLPRENAEAAAGRIVDELMPRIHKRKTAHFADLACNGNPALVPLYERYLRAARSAGLPCKIHADSTDPAAAVALAMQHDLASVDHLEHATDEQAQALGSRGMMATLLPGAGFRQGGRNAPARSLIDAGAAVAIGTDFNPRDSPTLNMQTSIALACLHLHMSIGEAITAATINAAHALGCAHRVGSLEPGKVADLVILNVADYHDLQHTIGTNVVHLTIKSGKVIYQEGDVAPMHDSEVRLSY
jgi:imidazolonepropionase